MLHLRPIQKSDKAQVYDLVKHASLGLTSLPKKRALLDEKIVDSSKLFDDPKRKSGTYLFVLEDLTKNQLLGISGIEKNSALHGKNAYFRVAPKNVSETKTLTMLHPLEKRERESKLCSLFLQKESRGSGLGALLSFGRFLFMASYPSLFCKNVSALMRPYVDEEGKSPFFETLTKPLYGLDFEDFMEKLRQDSSFYRSLTLPYPIYADFLPHEVQESIQKEHPRTTAAISLLKKQGFSLSDLIDRFDGGPKLTHETRFIKAVKNSFSAPFEKISDDEAVLSPCFLARDQGPFSAIKGRFSRKRGKITLDESSALHLKLKHSEPVRILPLL